MLRVPAELESVSPAASGTIEARAGAGVVSVQSAAPVASFSRLSRLKKIFWNTLTDPEPVGLPQPNIWTGAAQQKWLDATTKYANVPAKNFEAFVTGGANIPLKLEPPEAQKIYAALDTVMQKVLTDPNANLDQLLTDAEKQVNQILATVK